MPKGRLKEELTIGPRSVPNEFVAANGQEMGQHSSKKVRFRRQGCADVMRFGVEVTEETRPLVVVRRIAEQGNTACLNEDGGWIRDHIRGSQILLTRKRCCCVLWVDLLVGAPGFSWQA